MAEENAIERYEKYARMAAEPLSLIHILMDSLNISGENLEAVKQGMYPVSYTHLDVYKRQTVACAPSPAA